MKVLTRQLKTSQSRIESIVTTQSCCWKRVDTLQSGLGGARAKLEEVYNEVQKRTINRAIGNVLVSLLFVLYYVAISFLLSPETSFYPFFKQFVDLETFLTMFLGVFGLNSEKARELIDTVIFYPRVSSPSQEDGTSLDGQKDSLWSEFEKLDADHLETIGEEWESAHTMRRENVNKIINIVKNTDDTVCLMLKWVDRLSRADPLEACAFLWILREYDVILYFDELGYFDLSDKEQQLLLMFKLIESRDEYEKIVNRTDGGQKDSKKEGGFPAPTPYGYIKKGELDEFEDDNLKLLIDESESEVIQRCAEIVINGDDEEGVEAENVKAAAKQIENEYEDEDVDLPNRDTWYDILRRRKYIGELTHKGEQVGECPQLLAQDTYEELQEILGDRNSQDQDEAEVDNALLSVLEEFTVEASLEMFSDVIKPCCPECGSDVRNWGSDRRWGELVNYYRCENHPEFLSDDDDEGDESDDEESDDVEVSQVCDFEGPLLSDERLKEWDNSIPLTCPACKHYLDDESWKECKNRFNTIRQECDNCGTLTTVSLPKNKFERGFELPEETLKFFDDSPDEDSDSGNESKDDESNNDSDDSDGLDEDGYNSNLDDFDME